MTESEQAYSYTWKCITPRRKDLFPAIPLQATWNQRSEQTTLGGRVDSDPGYCIERKKWGHACLHRWQCHCADIEAWKAQFCRTRFFWRLEFSGKISESHATSMFSMHGDPPTRRNKDMVASKMCQKPRMACVRFFGCMGFAPGMLHRKHNHCNLKASQTALSTVLSWK
jgi:hypothetical protein